MMNDSGFTCTLCGTSVGDRYHCFDRRMESLVLTEQDGKVITTEHIANCQVMFIYCSAFCWDIHAPTVAAELQVAKPYPPAGLITPCSRCGNPVNRTAPHISYAISELQDTQTEPYPIAQCLDDREFAVLCKNCEAPDATAGAEVVDAPIERETHQ